MQSFMINVVGKNREVLNLVVEMNTQDQLFDKGIRANKTKIGKYSPFTIEMKRAKGQPFNHITLKDTGEFYESFFAFVDSSGDIEIKTEPIKVDEFTGLETNLLFKYGEEIVGLTPDNLDILNRKILIPVQKYVQEIFKS